MKMKLQPTRVLFFQEQVFVLFFGGSCQSFLDSLTDECCVCFGEVNLVFVWVNRNQFLHF